MDNLWFSWNFAIMIEDERKQGLSRNFEDDEKQRG